MRTGFTIISKNNFVIRVVSSDGNIVHCYHLTFVTDNSQYEFRVLRELYTLQVTSIKNQE